MPNMPDTPDHSQPPVVIAEFPHEFTAALARNALLAAGIPCQLTGIHTAGFRAEAPGFVRLLVPTNRRAEAQAIVDDFRSKPDDADAADHAGGPEATDRPASPDDARANP
jgi:hypothetical protein